MPKAKPTQIIVHRIELQQSERDTLEAALAGRFVTNAVSGLGSVITGLGNLLTPFTGVLTAIGALYLADKTLEELKEAWDDSVQWGQSWLANRYGGDYEKIPAFLNAEYAQGGWEQVLESDYTTGQGAQVQSQIWRQGYYLVDGNRWGWRGPNFVQLSNNTSALSDGAGVPLPQWLVDRFDIFIYQFRTVPRSQWEHRNPANLWEEFMPFSEYEQYVVNSVHPSGN